jgi:single-strand selective monofunctional uracil DNA glycosylase
VTDLVSLSVSLSHGVNRLDFSPPVFFVYNPLDYAGDAHREYLTRFATTRARVVFLGMNPGPWGMVQTGVPFGDVPSVRDWMGIKARIRAPRRMHPKRPILGLDCPRREISGSRLWGLFADRFVTPAAFFQEHFVANYCPLAFLAEGGRNITPDKISKSERDPLLRVCDTHLADLLARIQPEWAVGIGAFATARLRTVCRPDARLAGLRIGQILHPSPASPAANRGWAERATEQLEEMGVW